MNKWCIFNRIVWPYALLITAILSVTFIFVYMAQLQKAKSDFYELLPIFKEFQKNNLIDINNAEICFQGGSISVWDEFIPILNSAYEYGVKNFTYY